MKNNKNELLAMIIKEVQFEIKTDDKFYKPFIWYYSLKELNELSHKEEIFFNGSNLFSLGMLDRTLEVLGIKIESKWRMIDGDVNVNIIFNYNGRENSLYQSESIESQLICDDYIDLIFTISVQIYILLNDDYEASQEFIIEDYYDTLYAII